MEKLISDTQRDKHVYPILEMLNNKIKIMFKDVKIKFEILKNPEIRHLPTNHP